MFELFIQESVLGRIYLELIHIQNYLYFAVSYECWIWNSYTTAFFAETL